MAVAGQALVKVGPEAKIGSEIRVLITGPYPGTDPDIRDAYDTSLAWTQPNGEHCYIVIPPMSRAPGEGLDELEVTLAHEFFHCVQFFFVTSSVDGRTSHRSQR